MCTNDHIVMQYAYVYVLSDVIWTIAHSGVIVMCDVLFGSLVEILRWSIEYRMLSRVFLILPSTLSKKIWYSKEDLFFIHFLSCKTMKLYAENGFTSFRSCFTPWSVQSFSVYQINKDSTKQNILSFLTYIPLSSLSRLEHRIFSFPTRNFSLPQLHDRLRLFGPILHSILHSILHLM